MALSKHVRVGPQLKIDHKIKIIELFAEDSTLNSRKFTEKVNFRLNISVNRATVHRIIKDKDRILSVQEKYRPSFMKSSYVLKEERALDGKESRPWH